MTPIRNSQDSRIVFNMMHFDISLSNIKMYFIFSGCALVSSWSFGSSTSSSAPSRLTTSSRVPSNFFSVSLTHVATYNYNTTKSILLSFEKLQKNDFETSHRPVSVKDNTFYCFKFRNPPPFFWGHKEISRSWKYLAWYIYLESRYI